MAELLYNVGKGESLTDSEYLQAMDALMGLHTVHERAEDMERQIRRLQWEKVAHLQDQKRATQALVDAKEETRVAYTKLRGSLKIVGLVKKVLSKHGGRECACKGFRELENQLVHAPLRRRTLRSYLS